MRCTRELLEAAARETNNWDDAVRWCGGTATSGSRRYLRAKMREAGIDCSHFPTRWARHTEERLRQLVAESTSISEVVSRLGISNVGGNQTHISRRISALGIDTSHFAEEPLPERVRQRYTEERLREAAAHSESITGMLAYMGVEPYNSAHVHIAKLLERFGIETSRFPRRDAPSSRRLFAREEIAPPVARSVSMAGVMRALGHHPFDGAARARARRSIEEYGLSTEHFTGQGHTVALPPHGCHRLRSCDNSQSTPLAPKRRCCAEPWTTSGSHTSARSAALGTSGAARSLCWRSTM
ncbi:hypothetical protein [Streptomyces sp. NPDC091268]|uniref:hypothetical protein n=1 Tax=Streptomyces sp. NPDC091268 TaxID=3365979 RepID=UPI00382A7B62